MIRFNASVVVIGLIVGVLATAIPASAALETYTYEFTAADLFNHQYYDGEDNTTAAENELFDGARLLRVGTDGTHHDAGRTYVKSQHNNFDDRWETYTSTHVFDRFSLWGFDGHGANWGEDYKPLEWGTVTAPDGWDITWSDVSELWPAWYADLPDGGAHTELRPNWTVSRDKAISLDATEGELEDLRFSVTVKFNTEDAFWDQSTNDAPNSLGIGEQLTFWFGGYLVQYDDSDEITDYHMYEGNMVQAAVPEPATMAIWSLLALAGIGLVSRRRRRQG